jgi:hypothetical protein
VDGFFRFFNGRQKNSIKKNLLIGVINAMLLEDVTCGASRWKRSKLESFGEVIHLRFMMEIG